MPLIPASLTASAGSYAAHTQAADYECNSFLLTNTDA